MSRSPLEQVSCAELTTTGAGELLPRRLEFVRCPFHFVPTYLPGQGGNGVAAACRGWVATGAGGSTTPACRCLSEATHKSPDPFSSSAPALRLAGDGRGVRRGGDCGLPRFFPGRSI